MWEEALSDVATSQIVQQTSPSEYLASVIKACRGPHGTIDFPSILQCLKIRSDPDRDALKLSIILALVLDRIDYLHGNSGTGAAREAPLLQDLLSALATGGMSTVGWSIVPRIMRKAIQEAMNTSGIMPEFAHKHVERQRQIVRAHDQVEAMVAELDEMEDLVEQLKNAPLGELLDQPGKLERLRWLRDKYHPKEQGSRPSVDTQAE